LVVASLVRSIEPGLHPHGDLDRGLDRLLQQSCGGIEGSARCR
jgi:hypothetical protein